MSEIRSLLRQAPVVPVLTIERAEDALPLAGALLEGGLPVLEVTLRTAAGLEAIAEISRALPEAVVGAGTVISAAQYAAACERGSRFVVSPGLSDSLTAAAATGGAPLLPGVATASDMLRALDAGLDCLKFFPAEIAGGVAALRAFAGPFPQLAFCPTGGVGLHNLADYLALDNVITVGGTWMVPGKLVAAQDWDGISALAAAACERVRLLRSHP